MMKWITKIYRLYIYGAREHDFPFKKYGFFGERLNDPIYNCKLYKEKGCSHVNGYLCNMKTCEMLAQYKTEMNSD